MIKLIKENDETIEYWEVWENQRRLYIHQGVVGELGSTIEKKLLPLQNSVKLMNKLAEEMIMQGFEYLDEDKLIEVVIQYQTEEDKLNDNLEMRYAVEDLMNECLGWSGNGYCDGGDIGSGTMNIYCYVLDLGKGIDKIIKSLEENKLLDEARVSYSDGDDDYIMVHPGEGKFSLL